MHAQVTGNFMEAETREEAPTAQALQARLEEARARLDDLARDVCVVDAELEALSDARKQHAALQTACGALEDLTATGGAELFWGERTSAALREEYLRRARGRVAAFQKRLDEIGERRRNLLEQMKQQHGHTELLEDDAFEAQEEEERLRNEWIIEREINAIRGRTPMMPWTRGGEDDRRFRKSLGLALVVSLLFALVVPFIDLPLPVLQPQPEQLAKHEVIMMIEKEPLPTPPPVQPKPEEKLAKKPVEKPVPQPSPKPQEQPPQEAPGADQGILAFREKLESFKEAPIVASLGSQARINSDNSSAQPERSMLTTNAPGSSGGIKLAALSRNLGGNGGTERGAMQGSALTRATSSIKSVGPGDRPLSSGPGLSRTDEEIQIVFDRHKSSLYRLYNRELRKDPTLQGKMILRLTIEPDGSVSFCQLQSSDMNAPELSVQVVERVKTFDFGAKAVPAITIVYPIDFLPAA